MSLISSGTSLDGKIAAASCRISSKAHPSASQHRVASALRWNVISPRCRADPGEALKAERVLELNANHPVFQTLKTTMLTDKDKAKKYAELLYGQSSARRGRTPRRPAAFAELVSELMV